MGAGPEVIKQNFMLNSSIKFIKLMPANICMINTSESLKPGKVLGSLVEISC